MMCRFGCVVGEPCLADRLGVAAPPHLGIFDGELPGRPEPQRVELPGALVGGDLAVEISGSRERRAKRDQVFRAVRIELRRAAQMRERFG